MTKPPKLGCSRAEGPTRAEVLAAVESLIEKGLVYSKQDVNGQTRYYPTETGLTSRRESDADRPRRQGRRRARRGRST